MKLCSVLGCEKRHYARSLCNQHWYILRKYGDLKHELEPRDGHSHHPLYVTWCRMIQRCTNPQEKDRVFYKDRGIDVCERWRGRYGFNHFVEDMGEKPKGTSLDRIDNNKGYSKENCRWATPHQQSANTRRNKSGFVGVNFVKHRGTWDARIMIRRKVVLLGTYKDRKDAEKARQEAEIRFGIKK